MGYSGGENSKLSETKGGGKNASSHVKRLEFLLACVNGYLLVLLGTCLC